MDVPPQILVRSSSSTQLKSNQVKPSQTNSTESALGQHRMEIVSLLVGSGRASQRAVCFQVGDPHMVGCSLPSLSSRPTVLECRRHGRNCSCTALHRRVLGTVRCFSFQAPGHWPLAAWLPGLLGCDRYPGRQIKIHGKSSIATLIRPEVIIPRRIPLLEGYQSRPVHY